MAIDPRLQQGQPQPNRVEGMQDLQGIAQSRTLRDDAQMVRGMPPKPPMSPGGMGGIASSQPMMSPPPPMVQQPPQLQSRMPTDNEITKGILMALIEKRAVDAGINAEESIRELMAISDMEKAKSAPPPQRGLSMSAAPAIQQAMNDPITAAQSGDYATALRKWRPLAEQGNARAQTMLGVMYHNGKGVPQNYKTAVKWYTLAADQGIANAQNNLGGMYDNGRGVPQDYKTAVKWYSLSAEQGYANAQNNLGLMYDNGRGVLQDYKTAVKWWRLAAEQGHARAQGNLGWMYLKGKGVPQDYVRAHMWSNIAASSGDGGNASANRDFIAKLMNSNQIEKAQKLARECVDKNYKGC